MKSGNLNFLGPSGPLQACNGTTLPLLINVWSQRSDMSRYKSNIHFLFGADATAGYKHLIMPAALSHCMLKSKRQTYVL